MLRQARRNKAIEGHSLLCGLHRKPTMEFGRDAHLELPRVRPARNRGGRGFSQGFHIGNGFDGKRPNAVERLFGRVRKPLKRRHLGNRPDVFPILL